MIKIEIKDVRKEFKGHKVLTNINVSFVSGNIYGIVGRNGSGKTVLFKLICNMMQPGSGVITCNGIPITQKDVLCGNLGVVIERTDFIGDFSAVKNLKYLTSLNQNVGLNTIKATLEMIGLDPDSKQKYKNYSFGMKQKLALAQALYENPEILILDEPFNSLDKESIEKMKTLLIRARNEGKLILLATHNQSDLDELCDKQYTIEDGNLVEKT